MFRWVPLDTYSSLGTLKLYTYGIYIQCLIFLENFMDKRLQYFDIAKGIAIYSVILVHLNTFCGWNSNLLFYIIHSYFMPLFFFISGYFCYKQGIFDYSLYLRKKIKQLIVPYFTSCLFICFVYSYLFDVNLLDRYLFDSSKGGFWFLLTLFIFQLIYVCLKRFISKIK